MRVNVRCLERVKFVRVPTPTGKSRKWENILQSGKSQEILNILEKNQGILYFILFLFYMIFNLTKNI